MKRKRILIGCALLSVACVAGIVLSGCATTTQQAQTQYTQACLGASATLSALTAIKPKLNAAQLQAINTAVTQIDPICSGPLPTDASVATAQLTAAVTTLTVTLAAQATVKGK